MEMLHVTLLPDMNATVPLPLPVYPSLAYLSVMVSSRPLPTSPTMSGEGYWRNDYFDPWAIPTHLSILFIRIDPSA